MGGEEERGRGNYYYYYIIIILIYLYGPGAGPWRSLGSGVIERPAARNAVRPHGSEAQPSRSSASAGQAVSSADYYYYYIIIILTYYNTGQAVSSALAGVARHGR